MWKKSLLLLLLSANLAGCYSWHHQRSGPHYNTAKIYTNFEQIQGLELVKLGAVSGEACQPTRQDPPVTINQARNDIQYRGAQMGADGVLLEVCQITSSPGCIQQAICQGTAIRVTN